MKTDNFTTRLLLVMLMSLCFVNAGQAQTQVTENTAESFTLTLSEEAQEAINNGVPLSFNCAFARLESYWLFSVPKRQKNHQFFLSRQALSNRYIVKQDNIDTPHIFRSISEATNYIAASAVLLLESYNNSEEPISMRLSLNIYDLPGPMRLNAFISDAWDLDTDWLTWQSES